MTETAKSEITNDKELRDIEPQFRPENPLKSNSYDEAWFKPETYLEHWHFWASVFACSQRIPWPHSRPFQHSW